MLLRRRRRVTTALWPSALRPPVGPTCEEVEARFGLASELAPHFIRGDEGDAALRARILTCQAFGWQHDWQPTHDWATATAAYDGWTYYWSACARCLCLKGHRTKGGEREGDS